ncbi:DUF2380 domain-containing protein [Telmatospirillum siberiense]|uniref:DUF2380 domain-containing protein n=1 Tax=Telmatospirillum siberiense TaxID=382514 RepID=A0A2N3PWD5_9PROT|nr:DUF2380 domain-containing protein [Telmatospirillum siberiense]PKU24724.1 hypothetical protein CWS72_10355 [Telmatospirillum siberiense]
MGRTATWRLAALSAMGLVLTLTPLRLAAEDAASKTIAVAEFDYVDTSGEIHDQRDIHASRVRSFSEGLRSDLAQGGGYRVVMLDCRAACKALESNPAGLLAEARREGADLLVFGGIHKQSTLIQWLKVEVIDLRTQVVVFDRLMSFRGDDDASWQRAREFLARTLVSERPVP